MAPLTRGALITALRAAVEADADVDAAWEGGSAAFDALDEWSDIDLVAVVADAAVDAVFGRLEAALAALSPVELRLDMPATVGYSQRFYRLRDAGEFLVVDLVLIRRSDPLLFREVELHGHGQTWVDRRGILVEQHVDALSEQRQVAARWPALRASFAMFQHLVTKEIARGRAIDALAFYQAWTLRPLVEALRLLHCPARRNFGLRYLERDLPAAAAARVLGLAYVRDLAHLTAAQAEARAWFDRIVEQIDERPAFRIR